MSFERDINSSIAIIMDLAKQKIKSNLLEATTTNRVDLNNDLITRVCTITDASIEQALSLGYSQIEAVLKKEREKGK